MSTYAYDHRRVQTAVIGHANSDRPVILPMEADELDLWRKAHPTYTYWCGIQLGGCGGELSGKRYTHKVCHFAHHPSAPICHRTANGESSADHLFIKRGVQHLLDKQQVRGKVQTRNFGTGPGDAVDVDLPGTRRRLRFQLSALDYRAWRRATDELTEDIADLDWIFGPDTPVTREIAGRHGFCLRVRCETVGGERRVHIGAETHDRAGSIQWTPLEDCVLTPSGLTSPPVETIRLSRPRPRPASFPLQGGFVFAPVPAADAPPSSPFASENRHLLVADIRPVDSTVVRALISLPGDTVPPLSEHVYRVPDHARMLVLEDGHGWAVEVDRYVRLNAHDAQRTGLWTPPPGALVQKESGSVAPQQPAKSTAADIPETSPAAATTATQSTPSAQPRPLTRVSTVPALRDALADIARLRSTTTWEALARRLGLNLSVLSEAKRLDLLVDVDSPLSEYVPVLSALIRDGSGGPLPYLGDLLDRLGVPYAKHSSKLKRWAVVETGRAFAAYGQPARAMGPRLDLTPVHPLRQREAATAGSRLRAPLVPGSTSRRFTVVATRPIAAPAKKRHDERISGLIAELRDLRPKLTKSVRKSANKAITGAQVWLGDIPVQRVPKRIKAAAQPREHHIRALEAALKAARTDITGAEFLARHQAEQAAQRPPKQVSAPKQQAPTPPVAPRKEQELLASELIRAASRGEMICLLDLPGGRTLPDVTLRRHLTAVDRYPRPEVPLLSALVTAPDGGPTLFFRQILKDLGLAVPHSDEVLMMIWRREQERAHAAYANPPRLLPPRLVPAAQESQQPGPRPT
ncbi:hypothetical protein [Streptomyces sparsogenes]|uniref:Uncharacterized protein n=1 Tax=Streptomyces sparsogenes DSM 40356 TaxID=1331668 RepID=A0A1R1SPN8_9ACTN|nr:hypothetical protein [Streptomyces sparsogenes]OMI40261.1 hypothetical protein SPAR_06785 [Streptomyces sparsogenes DSM 40356]